MKQNVRFHGYPCDYGLRAINPFRLDHDNANTTTGATFLKKIKKENV